MLHTILLLMGGISEWGLILMILLPLFLIVWAIVDLTKRNFNDNSNKIIWAIFIILMPFLGAIAYMLFGRE